MAKSGHYEEFTFASFLIFLVIITGVGVAKVGAWVIRGFK